MRLLKHAPLLGLALCLSGCSTTITNLTPSRQTRNSTGLYPFEMVFNSNQKSLRRETIQPSVIVGLQTYPMQSAPVLKNRWETLVPIPADQKIVHYRFKVDFQYDAVPARRSGSDLSAPYQLELVDQ